jgi:hypothetical protein
LFLLLIKLNELGDFFIPCFLIIYEYFGISSAFFAYFSALFSDFH